MATKLPEGFILDQQLPEGFVPDQQLPEGFVLDPLPGRTLESTRFFREPESWRNNVPIRSLEVADDMLRSGHHIAANAFYFEDIYGIPRKQTYANYEAVSSSLGYTGNEEADFQKIGTHILGAYPSAKGRRNAQSTARRKRQDRIDKFNDFIGNYDPGTGNIAGAFKATVAATPATLAYAFMRTMETGGATFRRAFGAKQAKELKLFGYSSDDMLKMAQEIRAWDELTPEFKETYTGAIVQAGYDMIPTLTLAATTRNPVGSIRLSATMFGRAAAGASEEYRAMTPEENQHPATEFAYMMASGTAEMLLESITEAKIIKEAFDKSGGKGISGKIVENFFLEGGSEVLTGLAQDGAAKGLFDEDRGLWTEDRLKEFLASGVMSTATTTGMEGVNSLGNFAFGDKPAPKSSPINPEAIPSESEWKAVRERMTDEQLNEDYGPLAVDAANGDLSAQAEFREQVLSSKDGREQEVDAAESADAESGVIDVEGVFPPFEAARIPTKEEQALFEAELQEELAEAKAKGKADVAYESLKSEERIKEVREQAAKKLEAERERKRVAVAREVKKRMNAVKKKFKERQNLREAIADLTAIAKQFPKSVRDNILSSYNSISKKVSQESQEKVLNAAYQKMIEATDALWVAEGKDRIRKTIKSGLKGKGEALDVFNDIKEISEMSRDDALAEAKKIREQEKTTPEERERAMLLSVFGGVLNPKETRGFTANKIQSALDEAKFILSEGRAKYREKIDQIRAERKAKVDDAISDVIGPKGKVLTDSAIAKMEQDRSKLKGATQWSKDFFINSLDSLQFLFDNLSTVPGRMKSSMHMNYVRPTTEGIDSKFRKQQEYTQRVTTVLESVFGPKWRRSVAQWNKLQESPFEWVHQGERGRHQISKWQAVQWYMRAHEDGLTPTLLRMLGHPEPPKRGIKPQEEYIKEISEWWKSADQRIEDLRADLAEFIGSGGVRIASEFSSIYSDIGKEVDAFNRELTGESLDLVPGFAGPLIRMREAEDVEANLKTLTADKLLTENALNNSFKARSGSTAEIKLDGAHITLLSHINDMSHAMAYGKWAADANALLDSKEFQRAVRARSGSGDVLKYLRGQIEQTARGHLTMGEMSQKLNDIFGPVLAAPLILNFPSAGKQMASALAMMDVDGLSTWDYLKYSTVKPNELRRRMKALRNTDFIKERRDSGMQRLFRDLKSEKAEAMILGTGGVRGMVDKGLFATKYVDVVAILVGGHGVYQWAYDTKLKETNSKKEATKYANAIFSEIARQTQQSSAMQDIAAWQSQGPLGKLMTDYQTSPIQYQRNINNAIRAWNDGKISFRAMAKTFILFHFLMPQIFTAMGNFMNFILFDLWDDEKDAEDIFKEYGMRQAHAAVLGNLYTLPLLGVTASNFTNRMFGFRFGDVQGAIFDKLNQLGTGAQLAIEGAAEGDEDKIDRGFSEIVGVAPGGAIINKAAASAQEISDMDIPLVPDKDD